MVRGSGAVCHGGFLAQSLDFRCSVCSPVMLRRSRALSGASCLVARWSRRSGGGDPRVRDWPSAKSPSPYPPPAGGGGTKGADVEQCEFVNPRARFHHAAAAGSDSQVGWSAAIPQALLRRTHDPGVLGPVRLTQPCGTIRSRIGTAEPPSAPARTAGPSAVRGLTSCEEFRPAPGARHSSSLNSASRQSRAALSPFSFRIRLNVSCSSVLEVSNITTSSRLW